MNNEIDVLRHILDDTNQMIQVSEVDTLSVLYANSPAKKNAGNAQMPLHEAPCYKYMMGLDEQCPFCPLRQIGGNRQQVAEVLHENKILAIKTKLIDWNGKRAFIEYVEDITEVRLSEKRYRHEVETIVGSLDKAQGFCHVDIDTNQLLDINLTTGVFEGVDVHNPEQIYSQIVSEIASEEKKREFLSLFSYDNLHNIYAKGKKSVFFETEVEDGGARRTVRLAARIVTNPSNNHLEVIAFSYDITEEVKLKREMEFTNKLNEALACDFGTIFIINLLDGTMRIRKMSNGWNAQSLQLPEVMPFDSFFQQYAENFIVEEYRSAALAEISVENLRRRVESGESNISFRFKACPNSCGEENFEAVVIPVSSGDKYQLVIGCKCIDKLIEREERDKKILMESRAEAEAASKAKTSFLFNMSHDIRTPMNAIMGFTNLLEKHQDCPERRRDYLHKIAEASRVLLSIINNVLEMARIEKGTIQLDEFAWSTSQFNSSICTLFDDMMREKNIEFTHSINVQHPYVICDPTKTREVFFNII